MAKRRMFSLDIVDTDSFLELPLTTQALYFHLGMRADDDGFVSSPKRLLAMVGCSADDMRLLSAKGYVIPFSSGICVIRDWRVNNHIQKDRYHETLYISEKSALRQNGTGAYLLTDTTCIQDGYILDTEVRLGKPSQGKASLGEKSKADKPPRAPRFTPPTVEEVRTYCDENGYSLVDPEAFIDFYASKGWKVGTGSMKDWKASVRNWQRREGKEQANKSVSTGDRIWTAEDYLAGW